MAGCVGQSVTLTVIMSTLTVLSASPRCPLLLDSATHDVIEGTINLPLMSVPSTSVTPGWAVYGVHWPPLEAVKNSLILVLVLAILSIVLGLPTRPPFLT